MVGLVHRIYNISVFDYQTDRGMAFVSALLIGSNLRHGPANYLNLIYDMSVHCDAHMCNIFIPMEHISEACYLVEKMANYLHVHYECDVEDSIDN